MMWRRRITRWFVGLLPVVIVVVLFSFPLHVGATNLRGRVDGQHRYSSYPFPVNGVRVDLYEWTGTQWIIVYTTYTGPDGMYYMFNIRPGSYYLQVNNTQNYQVLVEDTMNQDIFPILIRY